MAIYYLLVLSMGVVSFFTSLFTKKYEKQVKIKLVLIAIGLVVIQGLRKYTVGTDVANYLIGYDYVKTLNVFSGKGLFNYEIGYILYSKLFSTLNFSPQFYLLIISITIITPITYIWYKNSKLPVISLLIYITLGFYTFSFSGLRQAIAISIIFYSFKYIQQRNFIEFILCIALAMSFHITAIIFVVAYPLYYFRLRPVHYLLLLPSIALIYVFKSRIYLMTYELFRGYGGKIEETGAYTMLIVMIIVYVLSITFGSRDKNNLTLNAYKNYMLMAILIQILASQSNVIMRAGYYYFIFVTLLIPEIISNQRDKYIKVIINAILIIALLYFFQTKTGNGYLNVSPYVFYWK